VLVSGVRHLDPGPADILLPLGLLDLDGRVIEGQINPVTHEIVHMHTAVYKRRADVGAVIHTHSPYSTSFAVANRPLEVFSEALARFGIDEPIPVAAYAPPDSPAGPPAALMRLPGAVARVRARDRRGSPTAGSLPEQKSARRTLPVGAFATVARQPGDTPLRTCACR